MFFLFDIEDRKSRFGSGNVLFKEVMMAGIVIASIIPLHDEEIPVVQEWDRNLHQGRSREQVETNEQVAYLMFKWGGLLIVVTLLYYGVTFAVPILSHLFT